MRPFVRISAGGNDLAAGLGDRLLSVEVHDEAEDKSDRVTIEIDDRPAFNGGGLVSMPGIGMTVEIVMGYLPGQSANKGKYLIDEITVSSPPRRIQVTGRAADMTKDYRTPRTKSYHQKTIGEIAKEIAGRSKLQPVIDPEIAGVVIRHIDQHNESDMAFATRLAGMHDGVARPMQGKLVVAKRGTGKAISGSSLPTIVLTEQMCASWDFKYSAREEAGKASGMKSSNYGGSGSSAPSGGSTSGSDYIIEAKDGGSGGGVRAKYTDVRTGETKVVTTGEAPYHDLRFTYHNETEAVAAVTAKKNAADRGKASFSCTIGGRPDVQAEAVLILDAFRPYIPTKWRITSCEHRYEGGGYTTTIEAELFEKEQEDAAKKIKKAKPSEDDTIDKSAPKQPTLPSASSGEYIIEAK